jgi:hypothetical protein
VVVDALPTDIQFDVAIRLISTVQDFQSRHDVEVVSPDPGLVEFGRLRLPVPPRIAAKTHIPGYEINAAVAARIDFTADRSGGYDLSFALDQQAQHRQKTTISVVVRQEMRER